MNELLTAQVVNLLKKSDQKLVFLDSKICPIRTLVGKSKKDRKMRTILKGLQDLGILEYYSGFFSLAEPGGFMYCTSAVLTKEFYNAHCRAGEQLTLFPR